MTSLLITMGLGLSFLAFAKPSSVPGEYVVKYRSGKVKLMKRPVIQTAESVIHALKKLPGVTHAEPNYIYKAFKRPNDRDYSELWGLNNVGQQGPADQRGVRGIDIRAANAWDITTGSKKVVVAVIDSGVDLTHHDLTDNKWENVKERDGLPGVDDDGNGFIDDIYGYNFVDNNGNINDVKGHGTHVAGTIGAKGNNREGLVGVAWDVSLMAVKFLSDQGYGTLENSIKSVRYAVDNGADVINASWGGDGYSKILEDEIKRGNLKGTVFVAAAGNSLVNNDNYPVYPANYVADNVISVAAISNIGRMANFSNFGKRTVHVSAPGVSIWSTQPKRSYTTLSGTSMAAPHVAGIIALMRTINPSMRPLDIRNTLIRTSRSLNRLRGKVVANGMVDAHRALTRSSDSSPAKEE